MYTRTITRGSRVLRDVRESIVWSMLPKTLGILFIISILFALSAVNLYGHCHTSDSCEDVHNDMIPGERWDTNHRNTVRYYVNDNFLPILPSLHPDVTSASNEWSNIWFSAEGERVNFELDYIGSTYRSPTQVDSWNVVGWGHHDWNNGIGVLAEVFPVYARDRPNELVEADMLLNYYAPFAPHSTADYDEYCLANVITHEFGHFIRLTDVDPSPQGDNCLAYAEYTMWNDAGPGIDFQESLACEDEYGAWYTYNDMRWGNAAPQIQSNPNSDVVAETQLLPNYPDPFNPETWIPFELKHDASVTIDIYDSSGGLVRTLAIGDTPKGSYIDQSKAVHWDGKDNNGAVVASGVYFYTLRADEYSQTQRMVILK